MVRQNGVADFHGALQNNNNAYSVDGDVIRQNGLVNTDGNSSSTTAATEDEDDGGRNEGTVVLENDPAPPTATNPEDVPTEDEDGRNNNNNDNDDVDDEDDIIVIHNRIINNTFTSNTQNGLIVTPTITVQNDMSDALYDNNKATSKTGKSVRSGYCVWLFYALLLLVRLVLFCILLFIPAHFIFGVDPLHLSIV